MTLYQEKLVLTTLYTTQYQILTSSALSRNTLGSIQTYKLVARHSISAPLVESQLVSCALMAQYSPSNILCVTGGIT